MPIRRFVVTVITLVLLAASAPASLQWITSDGVLYDITVWDEDLIRIQAARSDTIPGEGSGTAPIVIDTPRTDVDAVIVPGDDVTTITTQALRLVIDHKTNLMELRRAGSNELLWRELRPLALGDSTCVQTLDSSPDERFFGGGQQNGRFAFKGELMEISYSGGWEEGDRPSPAPFFMSDRGYGVLRNTWSDGVYDFRSDHYLTASHGEARFDAFVMVGDTYREVLDRYTRLTGRAPLLPRWALGYGDADCYNDGDNVDKPGTVPEGWSDGPTGTTPDVVASVAAKYREHDMPGSWILPNDGYGCGYEDLPGVVAGLRELGFRTGLWTENGVEKIAWEVGTAGTRVQKLDVAWTGKGYQWAMDANHDAARGFRDNSDARPFIWTVMGWAGIQRYAVTWTGDQSGSWDYIRWHVPTLIGSALSGMNYSTGDVDVIVGGSPETYTRDLQWKCFTPVLMGMSGWSKAERKHPWWFDEPYRSINRRYLKLRQRLMPYIYTLARETAETGAPMVRAMDWDQPRLAGIADDHPYQFLLGRDLLVAPVYRSQASSGGWREDVYLPEGRWIDWWSGAVLDGGRVVDVPVDLATLPVFVRAGAVIPMAPESLYDGEVPCDPLTLEVYPGPASEFTLYEDDGETRAYLDGAFTEQRIAMATSADGEVLSVRLDAALGDFPGRLRERAVELAVHTRVAPEAVLVDGLPVPSTPTPATFTAADRGWRYDPDDRLGTLHVKAGRLTTDTDHVIAVELDPRAERTPSPAWPAMPAGDGTIPADALMIVSRSAEEPGHPLENAFDGDPDTWFRTVRDQSVAYGPHEITLALGGRRVVEGFRIAPRNDKYWRYGQVRDWELYVADVNGEWGEPAATGTLDNVEHEQTATFDPVAGRLLRFRVVSTHDDEVDPMVLGAVGGHTKEYDALAPIRVGPTTISEFRIIERPTPDAPPMTVMLGDRSGASLAGIEFDTGLTSRGWSVEAFALEGDWHTFRAEVGIDDLTLADGEAVFLVMGDDRLLWNSGPVTAPTVMKPRLDVRGVRMLMLVIETSDPAVATSWADPTLTGYEGDTVQRLESKDD